MEKTVSITVPEEFIKPFQNRFNAAKGGHCFTYGIAANGSSVVKLEYYDEPEEISYLREAVGQAILELSAMKALDNEFEFADKWTIHNLQKLQNILIPNGVDVDNMAYLLSKAEDAALTKA